MSRRRRRAIACTPHRSSLVWDQKLPCVRVLKRPKVVICRQTQKAVESNKESEAVHRLVLTAPKKHTVTKQALGDRWANRF